MNYDCMVFGMFSIQLTELLGKLENESLIATIGWHRTNAPFFKLPPLVHIAAVRSNLRISDPVLSGDWSEPIAEAILFGKMAQLS